MLYEPGDMEKVIDTVIALDAAFGILFSAINKHDKALAITIAKTLKDSVNIAYDLSPAEQAAGIADKFREWASLLTNGPTPAGKH